MSLRILADGEWMPGPRDLARPCEIVTVRGEPEPEYDLARWAGAIGAAVLRGASVRRE